ncbi:MAG: membrane protein [Melioribacteraceae bacterium]|nr:MAG: membrane protein [Melioribacteraceae bacterium]
MRKLLHFVAITVSAVVPLLLSTYIFLKLITLISAILVVISVSSGTLDSIRKDDDKSWGILYFALFYTVSVFILPPGFFPYLAVGLLILAVSDSLAALSGSSTKKMKYILTVEKSYLGSFIFFVSSFIISWLFPVYFSELFGLESFDQSYLLIFAFVVSVLLTLIEALSTKGIDNLLIPLFGTILSVIFLGAQNDELLQMFVPGLFLAGVIAFISYKVSFLTANGSISTFILAGLIFGLGGWKWSLPIMTFFVLSSLLSKVRKKKNAVVESYFEKTGTRDFGQVFANGGVGGVLVIVNALFPNDIWYFAYIASLAAVTADTWATETGTLKKNKTYNILNFKPLPQGMSGGISVAGTTGGIIGAIIVTASGFYWFENSVWLVSSLLVIAGVFGSFVDSYLGATLQVQYNCKVCGKITENKYHCGANSDIFRGNKAVNNDLVNLIAGVFGSLFFILIWGLIQL